jgi:hypothetical protein
MKRFRLVNNLVIGTNHTLQIEKQAPRIDKGKIWPFRAQDWLLCPAVIFYNSPPRRTMLFYPAIPDVLVPNSSIEYAISSVCD